MLQTVMATAASMCWVFVIVIHNGPETPIAPNAPRGMLAFGTIVGLMTPKIVPTMGQWTVLENARVTQTPNGWVRTATSVKHHGRASNANIRTNTIVRDMEKCAGLLC
jgi:hypothetical protein